MKVNVHGLVSSDVLTDDGKATGLGLIDSQVEACTKLLNELQAKSEKVKRSGTLTERGKLEKLAEEKEATIAALKKVSEPPVKTLDSRLSTLKVRTGLPTRKEVLAAGVTERTLERLEDHLKGLESTKAIEVLFAAVANDDLATLCAAKGVHPLLQPVHPKTLADIENRWIEKAIPAGFEEIRSLLQSNHATAVGAAEKLTKF